MGSLKLAYTYTYHQASQEFSAFIRLRYVMLCGYDECEDKSLQTYRGRSTQINVGLMEICACYVLAVTNRLFLSLQAVVEAF